MADLFLRALSLCLQTQYISGKIGSRAYSLRQTEVTTIHSINLLGVVNLA
ncbi:MAG: hypothetical protein MRQ11_04035 [Candidatus Midichloria mitochondrii]|nr:hypothetical protein [Candidatus Midichloria mitochondrii]